MLLSLPQAKVNGSGTQGGAVGWRRWELAVEQPSHALDGSIGEAPSVALNGGGTLPTERVERALEDVTCEHE